MDLILPVALPLVIAVAAASAAAEDRWYEHYEKGENALNEQYWAEAIEQLTQSIELRAEPEAGLPTYGANVVNYFPYLKLGIAYFNIGQYDAALHAFETETRYGAIEKSPDDAKNLTTFSQLSQEALSSAVTSSLEEALALERKGQVDKALEALERGLALGGKDPRTLAEMKRLRELLEAHTSQRRLESLVRSLTGESQTAFGAGQYEKASSLLRQALILKANPEITALLQDSQRRLKEQLEEGNDLPAQRALVTEGVAEAGRLEAQARPSDALEKLQLVLALDPRNGQAMSMQFRLTQRLAQAAQRTSHAEEVEQLLAEGVDFVNQGMYDQAIATFSHALVLDPRNISASNLLWRSYSARNQAVPVRKPPSRNQEVPQVVPRVVPQEVHREVLQEVPREAPVRTPPPAVPKLPPTIALANTANAVDTQERREQVVTSPDFVLKGVILSDQSHVDLTILQDERVAFQGQTNGSGLKGDVYEYRFEQPFTLNPGVATLTVRADDRRGLVSNEVYRVHYLQPFTRSPWFYPSLALVALSAAGGVQGYRSWRRGRLRRRRFNPYVAGSPVLDEDLFIGRETLLSRILETIHNNSILLFGERRIGKTSLQHHLKKRLARIEDPVYVFYPVYIDLEGTPEEKFFARLAEDIFEELSPLLVGLRARFGPAAGIEYGYPEFIRDVREVLKALKERSRPKKARLVLLIDEVDELNNYDPRINQKLRSLFMKSFAEDLVAVVSGVGIKKHWASEGSPWYNFFEEIEVKPFTRADAHDLIERPIRGIFRLGRGAAERILDHTDCKPYLIQKHCVALINRMHDQGRREITVADVDAIGRPFEDRPETLSTGG